MRGRLPLPTSRAGRALLAFWAALLLAGAGVAGALQWLGPLAHRPAVAVSGIPHPATTKPRIAVVASAGAAPSGTSIGTPLSTPLGTPLGTHLGAPLGASFTRLDIVPPDAALLEPAPDHPGASLPRIAADGRRPDLLYAATIPPMPAGARRVAILLSGIGLSTADSLDAIDQLPAAVSLAVSPYAGPATLVLDAARKAGHELLLSLPMEPANTPLDDEGDKAMTEDATRTENADRLEWSLSRIQGYAGVTNAAGALGGESFAASARFPPVAHEIARRGLFYLDATPQGTTPGSIEGASADLRLDDPPSAVNIARQLSLLEQIARTKGSAIGVAGPLFPVTIDRLADWIHTLPTRGLVLVPVSSLTHRAEPVVAAGGSRSAE